MHFRLVALREKVDENLESSGSVHGARDKRTLGPFSLPADARGSPDDSKPGYKQSMRVTLASLSFKKENDAKHNRPQGRDENKCSFSFRFLVFSAKRQ